MELRQLAYFVAVAEEGHFTRAAERVAIAQPAVSQQIRRLEVELGEPLFVRDRRAVRLTPAGEALLPHARAALAQVQHGREAVAAVRGLVTGRLGVGLVQPLPDRRVLQVLGAFRRRHPGIDVMLMEGETDALLDALAGGELDAALIGLGRYDDVPPGVDALVVAREPVVVAVHPQHPLAARRSIPLAALRDEPMVTLTAASKLRTTLDAACQAAGFAPRIAAETSDLGVVIALAAEQIGVALLPQSALEGASGVVELALTKPRLERRIVLVSRPSYSSPAGRAFLALAREDLAPV